MTRHVVHSRALHNRKTLEMCLSPLSPKETGRFISRRGLREKAQLYMCFGGVPKYLEQIDPARSLEQNINRLCFSAHGFFITEYETLFKEQFRSIKTYESIVAALSRSAASLSELSRTCGTARGGGLSEQIQNLVRAQFIREYIPVSLKQSLRSKTRLYKLTDPFLIFYFRYLQRNKEIIDRNRTGENLFHSIAGPTIAQYYGYAFERLGEDAISEILPALGINLADVHSMGPYFQQHRNGTSGLQIDWLIIRRDGVINVLEFKYRCKGCGMEIVHDVRRKIAGLNLPDSLTAEPVLVSSEEPSAAVLHSRYFHRILTLRDFL